MNEPRVLILTRWFPWEEDPFQGTFVRDWARVASGISKAMVVHLASAGSRRGQHTVEMVDGLEVHRLFVAGRGARAPISHLRDLRAARRLIAELYVQKPFDLIHAHAYPAATAARLGAHEVGVPYVVTEHFNRLLGNDSRWFHRVEARFALRRAHKITAVGPTLATAMEKLMRQPIDVVPNPVSRDFVLADPPPPGPPFRLLSVGALRGIKGFDVGLEAIAILARRVDVRWCVAGDGEDRQSLVEHVARLGLSNRVAFLGRVPRGEVHSLIASSHAVLVPSRVETFSLVSAEALMTGRPVVATRSGGPDAFVGVDEGRVVDPEDPVQLADALAEVLLRPERYPPEQVAARVRRTFSEEAVGLKLSRVYRDVLGERMER